MNREITEKSMEGTSDVEICSRVGISIYKQVASEWRPPDTKTKQNNASHPDRAQHLIFMSVNNCNKPPSEICIKQRKKESHLVTAVNMSGRFFRVRLDREEPIGHRSPRQAFPDGSIKSGI